MEARKRQTDTERLRARIRAEATRLIAARGFGAISVNDVAQAVGISKQALLYHYPSREALHKAVIDHLLEHGNHHLLRLMSTLTSSEDQRLERAVAQIREFFDAEPDAARVILRELLDSDSEALADIRKGAEPWLRFMIEALKRGQAEGRIRRNLDPEATVAHVGSLVISTFALMPLTGWMDFGGGAEADWRERRLRETVRIVERYLFVPRPRVK